MSDGCLCLSVDMSLSAVWLTFVFDCLKLTSVMVSDKERSTCYYGDKYQPQASASQCDLLSMVERFMNLLFDQPINLSYKSYNHVKRVVHIFHCLFSEIYLLILILRRATVLAMIMSISRNPL